MAFGVILHGFVVVHCFFDDFFNGISRFASCIAASVDHVASNAVRTASGREQAQCCKHREQQLDGFLHGDSLGQPIAATGMVGLAPLQEPICAT